MFHFLYGCILQNSQNVLQNELPKGYKCVTK